MALLRYLISSPSLSCCSDNIILTAVACLHVSAKTVACVYVERGRGGGRERGVCVCASRVPEWDFHSSLIVSVLENVNRV